MTQWIIDRIVYDTEKATLLARNTGPGAMPPALNEKRLYCSNNGSYFVVEDSDLLSSSLSVGIKPLSLDDAIAEWNTLSNKIVGYKEAFPDIVFTDA